MFDDLFGIDKIKIQESTRMTAVALSAVSMILLEKGIVTNEEFEKYIQEAGEMIDKNIADKLKQQDQELKEKFPLLHDLFKGMNAKESVEND